MSTARILLQVVKRGPQCRFQRAAATKNALEDSVEEMFAGAGSPLGGQFDAAGLLGGVGDYTLEGRCGEAGPDQ